MSNIKMLCSVAILAGGLALMSGAQKRPPYTAPNPSQENQRYPRVQPEQAKVPVRQLFEEMWTQGRYGLEGQVFQSNCTVHFGNRTMGLQQAMAEGKGLKNAAPDLVMQINQMSVNGDTVTVSWTARGTHTHQGAGMKPTGKRFSMSGRSQFKIQNGKIVEAFNEEYRPELFRQLGVSKGQAFMFYVSESVLAVLSPVIPDRFWNLF
jgi:predicted ester cyclase